MVSSAIPTIQKPKPQKVHVTCVDGHTRRSKTITIYNATPEQVIKALTEFFAKGSASEKRPLLSAAGT